TRLRCSSSHQMLALLAIRPNSTTSRWAAIIRASRSSPTSTQAYTSSPTTSTAISTKRSAQPPTTKLFRSCRRMRSRFALELALRFFLLPVLAGCNRGPKMLPVSGKVIYNGRPLEFGVVMFQPPSGQPAQGQIQPDGTFTLSTYRLNDGAVVGKHKVRVACYESMRPGFVKGSGEQSLGKPLVPEKC